METNFKFSQEEKNLLKNSLSQFQNDVLKDSVNAVGGNDDSADYSRGTYHQFYSRVTIGTVGG